MSAREAFERILASLHVAANDRARDVLCNGDGLFDAGGYLYARTPEDNAELQGLLTRALPS